MPKAALFLSIILLCSGFFYNSYSFLGGDLPQQYSQLHPVDLDQASGIVNLNSITTDESNSLKRYLIFGSGLSSAIDSEITNKLLLR